VEPGQWIVGFKNTPGVLNAVVDKDYETSIENLSLIIYVIIMLVAITGITLVYRKTKTSRAKMG
jgi:hypothetical protein